MHFLAGLGKKLLVDKAKKKIAGKARGDLPTLKAPLQAVPQLIVRQNETVCLPSVHQLLYF